MTKTSKSKKNRSLIPGFRPDPSKSLDEQRKDAADYALVAAPIEGVEDTKGWDKDEDRLSCLVYWENPDGGDSIKGSFGVRFEPGTAKVIDWWWQ